MDFSSLKNFYFSEPAWLWALLLLPLIWILYALFYARRAGRTDIRDFADPHLLPHLMVEHKTRGGKKSSVKNALLLWSLVWTFGLLGMAGPRWDYTEVKAFAPSRDLVILLDLSKSMDAQDIKPSRLARAREEIADITRLAQQMNKGINTALIAFDSVPHMITPLTDDRETLERLLPSLNTGLVYIPGSNLAPALAMAGKMLSSESGDEKHVLVISDGSLEDGDAAIFRAEKELTDQGVRVHVMGIGTEAGAPVPDGKGALVRQDGSAVISRLEKERLRQIARDGKGVYADASYLEDDTKDILSQVNAASAAEKEAQKTTRFWEERFYVFLIPALFLLLPWFRRNAAFPVLLLILLQTGPAQAFEWRDLFLNKAQQGQKAVEQKQYDKALEKFDDPYRRGVTLYKAGKYAEAEKSFAAADRPDVKADAAYDRGNAQLMGGKIEDAVKTYQDVLKNNPDHEDARHNLEIAQKMLEQKKQQQQQNNQQDQKQDQKDQQDKDSSGQNQDKSGQQHKEGEQGQSGGQQNHKEAEKDDQKQDSSQDQNQKNEKSADQKEKEDQSQKSEAEKSAEEQKAEDQKKQQEAQQGQDQNQQESEAQKQEEQQAQAAQQHGKDNPDGKPQKAVRTQKDVDADQWLNRIQNSPETFLKNKFYIESKRQNAQQGENPW